MEPEPRPPFALKRSSLPLALPHTTIDAVVNAVRRLPGAALELGVEIWALFAADCESLADVTPAVTDWRNYSGSFALS